MMDVKNKKITVIGIGASGKSAALFLKSKGALVYATDSGSSPEIEKTAGYLRKNGINAQTRRHTEDFIKSSTLIVISPGIPPDSPAVKWAKKYNIEIISEIELAYCFCPGRIIAVTGSNGKSTTATLIAQILKDAGKNVVLCGNIGNAFIDEIEKISKASYVVLEVSSFQLEGIKTFKPYICVILNVSQNHLDRHADFKEYFSAKKMIYRYQDKNNYAVLNYDDAELRALKGRVPSNLFFFSRRRRIRGAYAENDKLYLNITRPQFLSGTEKFKLKQPHNVENFLAAAVCASICKVPAASIKKTLAGFKGLPHHIEPVARING
ncbi:MAG: UDP-N-acetylmuramoyl-L-alanine--D-glutamate ligase, partial [Candidatus Omnitrophica bacterium]|nr:UDP-N-acetylmuramoyl-L-alanine--D-glutamate ligase [Candidatus Omnitrophota bacterium]